MTLNSAAVEAVAAVCVVVAVVVDAAAAVAHVEACRPLGLWHRTSLTEKFCSTSCSWKRNGGPYHSFHLGPQ